MGLFSWLKIPHSAHRQAKWLYRRGVMRARLLKNDAAIEDYTSVIQMNAAPADIRAMALYNRALVHHAKGEHSCAARDLRAVLNMPAAAARIKTEARRKLLRMERAAERAGV